MLTPTPKLQLPQWDGPDDFEFTQVNDALQKVDTKLTPSNYTTALRPTGVDRYDGLVIYDTDLAKYMKWVAPANQWRTIEFGAVENPTVTPGTAFPNFTITSITLYHKNGIAQIYINIMNAQPIAAGNLLNVNVGNIPTPWRPISPVSLASGASGPVCAWHLSNTGNLSLAAASSAAAAGNGLSCGGTYILA